MALWTATPQLTERRVKSLTHLEANREVTFSTTAHKQCEERALLFRESSTSSCKETEYYAVTFSVFIESFSRRRRMARHVSVREVGV